VARQPDVSAGRGPSRTRPAGVGPRHAAARGQRDLSGRRSAGRMLFNLLAPLADEAPIFNLFRYLTFRSGGAVMTALVISFVMGPHIIRWLKLKHRDGQPIRLDGPESHLLTKKGTPTMGGVLILLALVLSTLLWAD